MVQSKIERKTQYSLGASLAVQRSNRDLTGLSQERLDGLERAGRRIHQAREKLRIGFFDLTNVENRARLRAYLAKGGAR